MVMRMLSQESFPCPDGLTDLLGAYRPLHVRYAAEELICREGAFAAGLQWITQGLVLETEGGSARGQSDAPPDLLSQGDLMGIEILLPALEERHRTSCRALTEVSLLFLDRASLERALAEDCRFSALLVGHLATRCFRLRRARARQVLDPVSRLAATLLDVTPTCQPVEGEESLALPEVIDVRMLGELSGLSPTQMRRALRELPGLRTDGGQMVFNPRDLAQDALLLREGEASERLLDDR
jgi:CRP-like cAMP-binding protein